MSDYDYASVCKFANYFGVSQLRYGLNQINSNILIWIYQAVPEQSKSPHEAFETKQIYKFIEFISLSFKNDPDFDVNKYQPIALLANEFWFSIYQLINKMSLKSNLFVYFYDSIDKVSLNLSMQHDNLYLCPTGSNFNFFNVPIIRFRTYYSVIFNGVESNSKRFSYGIFNWNTRTFIKLSEDNVLNNKEYCLNFFC